MSVSSTTSSVTYAGNASTSAAYPVPFQFIDATDLVVVVNTAGVPTTLVLGTGYTASGGAGSTGSIVTTSAIPATSSVIISRNTAKTQLTSYTTGDRFPATTHEKALDKLTMLVQEAAATAAPPTSTASGTAPYVLQASSAGANPSWVPQSTGGIAAGAITNTMLAGGITPGKLSTGGPVWDASGNLTATSFVGNASTATSAARLTTPRTIALSGDVTGTASFDGSANATIAATVPNNTVTAAKLGTNERLQICKSWVNFNGSLPTAAGLAYARTGTTVTVTWTGHAQSTGFQFIVQSATDTGLISTTYYTATVVNVNTITFQTTSTGAASGTLTLFGNVIRSSYNASSITKNGTGDYTVNFATAMADANYSTNVSGGQATYVYADLSFQSALQLTTSVRVVVAGDPTATGNGLMYDPTTVSLQVFGN